MEWTKLRRTQTELSVPSKSSYILLLLFKLMFVEHDFVNILNFGEDFSGYMSPEYVIHGQFSMKSDVYSFGVLVLEIITGRKNSSFYERDGAHNLVTYVS